MKKLYFKIILFTLFILQLYLPVKLTAQCMCGAGIPATAMEQTIVIPPTASSSLTYNFQQFNPSIGTLSCVSLADTVTGTSITGAINTSPTDTTAFLFLLSLTTKISGPGILVSHPFSQQYGYDTLTKYGTPHDTITYGPANIITNPIGYTSAGSNSAYLGNGTVPITYAVNGGMITQDGGANYKSSVSTTIGGTLSLTYYFCPLATLATNMQNFTAFKNNNNIILNWNVQNAKDILLYDIEYSTDGKDFVSVAQVAADHSNETAKYNYNYALNGNNNGYIYFRIKQTSDNSEIGYSTVEKVSLDEKTAIGIGIRPNPAITGMTITFDHLLSGNYAVDLVNTAGQVVFNKKLTLSNNNTIPVSWTNKPAPGIYFTRVTNTSNMEQQIIRVVIQ